MLAEIELVGGVDGDVIAMDVEHCLGHFVEKDVISVNLALISGDVL